MRRVVFDTNVWVSGIAFEGEVRRVILGAMESQIYLAISPALLEELERVLLRRKFGYEPAMVSAILSEVQTLAHLVHPKQIIHAIKDDPADNRVLECALESRAEFIVSGDNHLLKLGSYMGIKIVSPKVFLNIT